MYLKMFIHDLYKYKNIYSGGCLFTKEVLATLMTYLATNIYSVPVKDGMTSTLNKQLYVQGRCWLVEFGWC